VTDAIKCGRCQLAFVLRTALAQHLISEHGAPRAEAVVEARRREEATETSDETPPPTGEPPMAQGKPGTGKRCSFCKRTDHTSTRDCDSYADYRKRKKNGTRVAEAKPSKRGASQPQSVNGRSAIGDAIRAEIASFEDKTKRLRDALAVLES
jgi:hypothetical protein